MFYCDDCANEYGYPESIMKSEGKCEICGKQKICNDVPSSCLPRPQALVCDTETQGLTPKKQIKMLDIKMLDITDAMKLFDANELVEQINVRNDLISQMSGRLYPSILEDEVQKLRRRLTKLVFNELPIPNKLQESITKGLDEIKKRERVNLPVIEVPSTGKPDWSEGARTMAFVYSKFKGNFILRGFRGEVENFLKKNFTHYFVYFSMWADGESRGYWHFWRADVTMLEPNRTLRRNKRYKYEVYQSLGRKTYNTIEDFAQAKKKTESYVLKFKRLPHHWIPEFDKFI
jgi:hypothetical protein